MKPLELLFLLLLQRAHASDFAQGVEFGDVGEGNFVRDAQATLTVPPGLGSLDHDEMYSLWPGLQNDGFLVQSLVERKAGDPYGEVQYVSIRAHLRLIDTLCTYGN